MGHARVAVCCKNLLQTGLCLATDRTQGFIHPAPAPQHDTEPLPSLELSRSLVLNSQEVAHAFHLPFEELISPARLRLHDLRRHETEPYWAVNVSDYVTPESIARGTSIGQTVHYHSDPDQRDEVGGGIRGQLEVWGECF